MTPSQPTGSLLGLTIMGAFVLAALVIGIVAAAVFSVPVRGRPSRQSSGGRALQRGCLPGVLSAWALAVACFVWLLWDSSGEASSAPHGGGMVYAGLVMASAIMAAVAGAAGYLTSYLILRRRRRD